LPNTSTTSPMKKPGKKKYYSDSLPKIVVPSWYNEEQYWEALRKSYENSYRQRCDLFVIRELRLSLQRHFRPLLHDKYYPPENRPWDTPLRYLGYENVETLISHLETTFHPGFTWKNWRVLWRIGHKIPLFYFNYENITDPGFFQAWNLPNLFAKLNDFLPWNARETSTLKRNRRSSAGKGASRLESQHLVLKEFTSIKERLEKNSPKHKGYILDQSETP